MQQLLVDKFFHKSIVCKIDPQKVLDILNRNGPGNLGALALIVIISYTLYVFF